MDSVAVVALKKRLSEVEEAQNATFEPQGYYDKLKIERSVLEDAISLVRDAEKSAFPADGTDLESETSRGCRP